MNTVVLEVRSFKEALADAERAMKTWRAEREARISFATQELLWEVLTGKRWELLTTEQAHAPDFQQPASPPFAGR